MKGAKGKKRKAEAKARAQELLGESGAAKCVKVAASGGHPAQGGDAPQSGDGKVKKKKKKLKAASASGEEATTLPPSSTQPKKQPPQQQQPAKKKRKKQKQNEAQRQHTQQAEQQQQGQMKELGNWFKGASVAKTGTTIYILMDHVLPF